MPIMARTRAQNYDPYSDWQVGADGREVNALGQHKIVGYSPDRTPSRGFNGLNEFNTRQNYGGTRQAIDNFANDARKAGELVGKDGGRMLDTWENRGYKTHLSDQNPYAAPVTPQGTPAVPILPPGAPSAENQRFADRPAPKGAAAGEGDGPEVETGGSEDGGGGGGGGGGGEPQRPVKPWAELGGFVNDPSSVPAAAAAEAGKVASQIASSAQEDARRSAANPYRDPDLPMNAGQIQSRLIGSPARTTSPAQASTAATPPPATTPRSAASPYSREQNVANAKADGSFGGIRDQYNKNNLMENAHWMDENGGISVDEDIARVNNRSQLQPLADEIAARRDFDRGEAPVQFSDPMAGPNANEINPEPVRATKTNPYGTATATFGGPPTNGGTMKDPLTGNTVPIKQWTSQQSAVQDTKYGPGAAQAGENYFGAKETPGQVDANRYVNTAISAVPLGQDDAEQYRAIARGGKIPRSSKA